MNEVVFVGVCEHLKVTFWCHSKMGIKVKVRVIVKVLVHGQLTLTHLRAIRRKSNVILFKPLLSYRHTLHDKNDSGYFIKYTIEV